MATQAKADQYEFMTREALKRRCRFLEDLQSSGAQHNQLNHERVRRLLSAMVRIENLSKGRGIFRMLRIRLIASKTLVAFRG